MNMFQNINLKRPLSRLRLIGAAEGMSFLLLMGIGMPLKYFVGLPLGVKIIGWIHGILFILYCLTLLQIAFLYHWKFLKITIAFIASLIPFGTFFLEASWKQEEETISQTS